MLKRVISGAQVGSDIASLRAAKAAGIETGGTVSKNCRTIHGDKPELITEFGLTELPVNLYPPRTYANVKHSDGTLRLARDFHSRGEICTKNAIDAYRKPYLDIDLNTSKLDDEEVRRVLSWIDEHAIEVLNVAGSAREDIEPLIEDFLKRVFTLDKISCCEKLLNQCPECKRSFVDTMNPNQQRWCNHCQSWFPDLAYTSP